MNDQNTTKQVSLSEEAQELEEADLKKVTGGIKLFPFDGGDAAPAAEKVIKPLGNVHPTHIAGALELLNLAALHGRAHKATVSPSGRVIMDLIKK